MPLWLNVATSGVWEEEELNKKSRGMFTSITTHCQNNSYVVWDIKSIDEYISISLRRQVDIYSPGCPKWVQK